MDAAFSLTLTRFHARMDAEILRSGLMNPYSRTALLLGEDAMRKLKNAKVAVFGLGGVGGYVVEALARSGVGALELIDHDTISLTNLNRQLLATRPCFVK